ncbi:MAG: carbon storage regulator [Planctomycetales bacterium]|jgi:carbon storage regulator|nr:carbon storage regulator [Planctomycetales bacterium]
MLILTRKRDESIKIGESIVIRVIRTGRGSVKIGIDAPDSVRIVRGELSEFASLTDAVDPHLAEVNEVDIPKEVDFDQELNERLERHSVYDLDLVMQH